MIGARAHLFGAVVVTAISLMASCGVPLEVRTNAADADPASTSTTTNTHEPHSSEFVFDDSAALVTDISNSAPPFKITEPTSAELAAVAVTPRHAVEVALPSGNAEAASSIHVGLVTVKDYFPTVAPVKYPGVAVPITKTVWLVRELGLQIQSNGPAEDPILYNHEMITMVDATNAQILLVESFR